VQLPTQSPQFEMAHAEPVVDCRMMDVPADGPSTLQRSASAASVFSKSPMQLTAFFTFSFADFDSDQ
jgi:hypothetical protein